LLDTITSDSKVITLDDYRDDRYRFIILPVWLDWGINRDKTILKKQVCVIALKDTVDDVHVIHGLSDFIISIEARWRNSKFNTQRKHANNIVPFLNFLLDQKRNLKINNLTDIDISTGTDFLNHLKKKQVNRGTIIDVRRTLIYFYLWLYSNKCLPKVDEEVFSSKKRKNIRGDIYYENIFKETLPSRSKKNREHMFPTRYIPLFFELAILYAHPIVFGLYLQMFGGLRAGEVVNLSRTQFKRRVKQGDFILNIKDRTYRDDLKDSSGANFVKKARHQTLLKVKDWADVLYHDHIEYYGVKDTSRSGALFINRDGNPMAGKSYYQYFDKLKRVFIEFLTKHGDAEDKLVANHLRISNWGSHIGRGTFTNLVAEETDNILELAFMRGDSDIMSALPYMAKTERLRKKLEQRLAETHSHYVPRLIEAQEWR
jgi:site-specific recombinase XerD